MTRYIPITDCSKCHYKDHKGGFAKISYVPVCRANNQELPYTISTGIKGNVTASATNEIPSTCPLPELNYLKTPRI